MRAFALILAFCLSTGAAAFQPRIGLWGNPNENGSGYMLDIQNGILVLTSYSYLVSGPAQWYLSSGPLTNNGQSFTATLDKYTGGQCISCTYRLATLQGNDGTITINFQSETLATLNLPGGRTTTIQPVDFGYGALPQGLFGEWIFVYDVGTATFADRFNFTTALSASANGTGIAYDSVRKAGCELQTSGTIAGNILCLHLDSGGNVQSAYLWRYGLDETFGGQWLSPSSGEQAAMKGFRVASKDGLRRSSLPPSDGRAHALTMRMEAKATAGGNAPSTMSPEFAELAARLRGALPSSTE